MAPTDRDRRPERNTPNAPGQPRRPSGTIAETPLCNPPCSLPDSCTADPSAGHEMLPVADSGFSLPLAEGYYPDATDPYYYCQDIVPDTSTAIDRGALTPDCSHIYLNTPGMEVKPQVHAITIERRPRVARRTAEQAAVRALLERMVPGASLCNAPSGRPYLVDEGGHELPVTVSVTHSRHYAAVAVNNGAVGIDLEEPRSQLLSVATRFLSRDERFLYCKDIQLLLSAWTAKEAVYKAYHAYCALNGVEPLPVDFATDLELVATQGAILPTGRASFPASGARLHGSSFRLTHSCPFGSSMLTVATLVDDESLHRNLVVDVR